MKIISKILYVFETVCGIVVDLVLGLCVILAYVFFAAVLVSTISFIGWFAYKGGWPVMGAYLLIAGVLFVVVRTLDKRRAHEARWAANEGPVIPGNETYMVQAEEFTLYRSEDNGRTYWYHTSSGSLSELAGAVKNLERQGCRWFVVDQTGDTSSTLSFLNKNLPQGTTPNDCVVVGEG